MGKVDETKEGDDHSTAVSEYKSTSSSSIVDIRIIALDLAIKVRV